MYRRDASQIVTFSPAGADPRWLGSIGYVGGLRYSFTCPGGPDQMSATLLGDGIVRQTAIDPGRIVGVYRGGCRVWDGRLTEPVPTAQGWQIQAAGSGTFGADYAAEYTTWNLNSPVDRAITRGLRWVNPGIGSGFLGTQPDSASITVADFLSQITIPAGLIWQVGRRNVLSVSAPPTAVTRLLVAASPAARTLNGYYTQLWIRYESAADNPTTGAAATFATTSVTNSKQAARHGTLELFTDLSAAGVMSSGTAQATGTSILAKYTAASYAGTFAVGPGQLLNTGGTPVDLGCEQAGSVVRLLMAGGGYGGEVSPALPVQFVVGAYEYDDDSGLASITPFQSAMSDLPALLGNWVTTHTPIG